MRWNPGLNGKSDPDSYEEHECTGVLFARSCKESLKFNSKKKCILIFLSHHYFLKSRMAEYNFFYYT